ncbi:pyridoxamine 5'-phosphate oxidase family protein [Dermatophilus congolensis]|uniref:pyridoxamine 5'-phosphate oxidase family protein n=1 Tax=Dermatophilus congolensis TaxID=1863 RepID=UPI001AAEEFF0|nr:pyridoxamine 5'-phosphate oxidase family protein [Dermatophilus congolensis]MBO3142504.1 pyridoxamine 5'-phosphate oxidase family protein [Dermatophilus congolensis]MBO3151494.1 pyridoxamine 5'-phosphate oxidase family protein [Dermatophilus congolensis]MBO3161504.1 pyridoxamine 5'-phosphate oxidase family protein [Dermatophilus congolensis]MBO3162779.1 pyridoxamine 5'-phosphate oxidase family protein [Dermatophilus congolensis]MBO3176333.1 pyridoxamine 5'-phosphate oxidase family protein [
MGDEMIHEMTKEEAVEVLESLRFGRLATAVAGVPFITPLNYVARDGAVYFRTAEGNKLMGLTINADVAFEADRFVDGCAESVIVLGRAEEVVAGQEREFAESLPLQPWIETDKQHVVKIAVGEISGRRFQLNEFAQL